ncbi:O-antigen ligase family protein [Flavobacteriaceae bacterium KMM 6898]|nr:O-antigen ligase family protein [Flavobacteriaceae bacterium KMM 6898]
MQFNRFKAILGALLGFYPFYYFAYKGRINYKTFELFLIVIIPIIILQFFYNQANYIDKFDNENVVNNVAYLFVLILPFLFLIRNRIIALTLLAVILYFVIQGAKRGALFAAGLGTMAFIYYIFKNIKFSSKIKRIRLYFTIFSGLLVVVYLGFKKLFENEFLLSRLDALSEGNTSNRTEIYATIFNFWYSTDNFMNFIFGFGFGSSLEITGGYFAHNDWLELLSNFGVIGVLIYLFLIFSTISYIRNNNHSLQNRMMLLSIVLIWFFMTMVSMWYTSLNTFLHAILLGYIYGNEARKKTFYKL